MLGQPQPGRQIITNHQDFCFRYFIWWSYFKPSHINISSLQNNHNGVLQWVLSWYTPSAIIICFNIQNRFLLRSTTSFYTGLLTGLSLICKVSEFSYRGIFCHLRRSNRDIQLINALGRGSRWKVKFNQIFFELSSHNLGIHAFFYSRVTNKIFSVSSNNNGMILNGFFQYLFSG